MSQDYVLPADLAWTCRKCGEALVKSPVVVEYLGNQFTAELPVCPTCGRVLVSEVVARGRMAEVEQILEDK
ncbi:MAG: DNA-binding protein [Deltaproteobacteria bacterium]|nr:DNA-binding protein [Deltaproteobacteria bacterium]